MNTYEVKDRQNLFDVAVALYGSIEGVFDLLLSNPGLGMDSELVEGDVLNYHGGWQTNPSVASALRELGVAPCNGWSGERWSGPPPGHTQFAMLLAPPESRRTEMFFRGTGSLAVDWGNGDVTEETVTEEGVVISHRCNAPSKLRLVKFYGAGLDLSEFDILAASGEFRLLAPLKVASHANRSDIKDESYKALLTK